MHGFTLKIFEVTDLSVKVLALRLALILFLAAIFLFDTFSRLEIAAAVFYIVAILFSAQSLSRSGIIGLSGICTALTFSSFLLTKTGDFYAGIFNCAIAILALIVTTYILVRAKSAEQQALAANEQLTRVARIQSLGELIASIGHEINQPLAAAAASADACRNWLNREQPDIRRAKTALDRIRRETKRASEIIDRIRSLSKNETLKKELCDLNNIIDETLGLSKHQIDANGITLEWDRGEEPLMIRADRVQMMQVISNLLLNAIAAVRLQKTDNRFITLTSRRGDGKVSLIVTDTGCGIDNDDLTRVFDAFWTKRAGGTGLGLTLCRAIVEAHKGLITVRHNPHGGASFTIELPEALITGDENG